MSAKPYNDCADSMGYGLNHSMSAPQMAQIMAEREAAWKEWRAAVAQVSKSRAFNRPWIPLVRKANAAGRRWQEAIRGARRASWLPDDSMMVDGVTFSAPHRQVEHPRTRRRTHAGSAGYAVSGKCRWDGELDDGPERS